MSGEKRCLFSSQPKKTAISCSARAQLQVPVSQVDRLLQEPPNENRLNPRAPVSLTGVLEYVTANILRLVSQEAEKQRRTRITPELLSAAVKKAQRVDHRPEDGVQEQAAMNRTSAGTMRLADNQHCSFLQQNAGYSRRPYKKN